jgi:hypothetical protein
LEHQETWNNFFQKHGYRFPEFEEKWNRLYGNIPEEMISNENIESYTKIVNKTDILADKSQACFHACECNRFNFEHAINTAQSQNCSPKTPAKNKSNFDISLDEMSFLKHAFSLVKFSMMGELFEQFKDAAEVFFNKMDDLARKTKDNLINTVASKLN